MATRAPVGVVVGIAVVVAWCGTACVNDLPELADPDRDAAAGDAVATGDAGAGDAGSGVDATDDCDSCAGPEPLVLRPVADTFIRQESSSSNYGSATELTVDGDTDRAQLALLRFDVPALPAAVATATLRLHVVSDNPVPEGPVAHVTTSDWVESAVTWDTRPFAEGDPVAEVPSVSGAGWLDVPFSGAAPTTGLRSFVLSPRHGTGVRFDSREGLYPPQLVLTFVDG